MYIELYKTLMSLVFPIIKATYIKNRKTENKEPSARFNERVGKYYIPRPQGKLYWFHGASVGESISMLPLIDKLLKEDENLHIMVTTSTITSADVMEKRLPKRAFHQYIPFDVPLYAKRIVNHFKPDAVLWFESELWPSLLSEIKKHNLPLILVNGRVSDKSYNTWKRFRPIAKEVLSCFDMCLAQSELDNKRLTYLGAPNVKCVGNLKFAALPLPVDETKKQEIVSAIGNRRVVLLSSTHSNEEEQLATHLKEIKNACKNVIIISIPRHPHRGKEVNEIFQKNDFITALRSKGEPITEQTEIYVADTIGEMGIWYSIASISFVGGSLINHGGQNFVEPSRDKNAVIVGPNMQNFREMLQSAKIAHAVWQKHSASDVVDDIIGLLNEEEELTNRQNQAYNWAINEAKVLHNIQKELNSILNKKG